MHKLSFPPYVALIWTCSTLLGYGQQSYSPLSRDAQPPTAFSIIYRNSLCIVAAKPYPPTDAVTWKWQEGDTLNAKQAKLFKQPETDVYVFGTPPAGTHKNLNYNPSFELNAGAIVQAIRPDGSVTAAKLLVSSGINRTYRTSYGPVTLMALADGEYATQIPAGSPVVLADSNQVIGSVVPGRKPWPPYEESQRTNYFTFEVLCLPDPAQPVDSGAPKDMPSFLGYPVPITASTAARFRWILPHFLWDVQIGIPMAELAAMRKFLKPNVEVVSDPDGKDIRPDAPLFYELYYHEDPANGLLLGEINLYGEEGPRFGRYEKTTKLIEALIGCLGSPTVFSNTSLQPQDKHPEFVLGWQSSGRSVMLRLFSDHNVNCRLHVSAHTTNSATSRLAKSQKFGAAPAKIQEAFELWRKEDALKKADRLK